jgi:hypothetical protein
MEGSYHFDMLRQRFEAAARDLRVSPDPKERRNLLRRMRLVISELETPELVPGFFVDHLIEGTSLQPPRVNDLWKAGR